MSRQDREPKIEPEARRCPWCGSRATIQPWHGGGPRKRLIECGNEDCLVNPSVTGSTRVRALMNWNTRAEPSP